jgi:hypothetical protein
MSFGVGEQCFEFRRQRCIGEAEFQLDCVTDIEARRSAKRRCEFKKPVISTLSPGLDIATAEGVAVGTALHDRCSGKFPGRYDSTWNDDIHGEAWILAQEL